jgi:hypothetical protein
LNDIDVSVSESLSSVPGFLRKKDRKVPAAFCERCSKSERDIVRPTKGGIVDYV